MKKLSILGSLLALILMLVIAVPAHAEATTFIMPYNDTFTLSDGEVVDVTGFWRGTSSMTMDANGGRHMTLSMNLINCIGIGQDTLNEYLVVGSEIRSGNWAPGSYPQERTQIVTFKFISKGRAPNKSASYLMHTVVNADGETIVYFEK